MLKYSIQFELCNRTRSIDYREILAGSIAIGLCLFWFFIRKTSWAWPVHCIIGEFICIELIRSIRLSNFKNCVFLLAMFYIYDVYMVYFSSYFTGKDKSVMEFVATGGNSGEMLPMMFRVPRFGMGLMSQCFPNAYSLLGYADVLIPGLAVAYCHFFDLITNQKRIYFYTTGLAYGIGLVIAFGSLLILETGQPALFYLVPCTLIPPAALAYYRKEFPSLWSGIITNELTAPGSQTAIPMEGNNHTSESA